jgi:hypothetical protein
MAFYRITSFDAAVGQWLRLSAFCHESAIAFYKWKYTRISDSCCLGGHFQKGLLKVAQNVRKALDADSMA